MCDLRFGGKGVECWKAEKSVITDKGGVSLNNGLVLGKLIFDQSALMPICATVWRKGPDGLSLQLIGR